MERRTRRFGLADMLILIAALGAGMYGARELWRMLDEKPGSYWTSVTPSWLMAAAMAASVATPHDAGLPGVPAPRPRPPRRRLWTQPGTAAMLACTLLFVVKSVEVAGAFARRDVNELAGQAARVRVSDTTYLIHVGPSPLLLMGGASRPRTASCGPTTPGAGASRWPRSRRRAALPWPPSGCCWACRVVGGRRSRGSTGWAACWGWSGSRARSRCPCRCDPGWPWAHVPAWTRYHLPFRGILMTAHRLAYLAALAAVGFIPFRGGPRPSRQGRRPHGELRAHGGRRVEDDGPEPGRACSTPGTGARASTRCA